MNPTLTIQNATGTLWHVTFTVEPEGDTPDRLQFTVRLPKSNAAILEIERAALERARLLIDKRMARLDKALKRGAAT